jgi:hypothetical protein
MYEESTPGSHWIEGCVNLRASLNVLRRRKMPFLCHESKHESSKVIKAQNETQQNLHYTMFVLPVTQTTNATRRIITFLWSKHSHSNLLLAHLKICCSCSLCWKCCHQFFCYQRMCNFPCYHTQQSLVTSFTICTMYTNFAGPLTQISSCAKLLCELMVTSYLV